MKPVVTIAFSLLLIVAQTFVGRAAVSSGLPAEKLECCGDGCHCHCCVKQSNTPGSVPVETVQPESNHQTFILPPGALILALTPRAGKQSSADLYDANTAESVPLFLRDHALLI